MKIKKFFILKNYIDFLKSKFNKRPNISYSQCGEDIIISYIFHCLNIEKPTYLDIGAHHPFHTSNTALLYKNGSSGVCIEPHPILFKYIQKKRKADICLNVGVGTNSEKKISDFYIMSSSGLSTFSKSEAERFSKNEGQKIESVIKVPILPINKIISENFKERPNFISIDIEGLDFEVLNNFDFNKYRPEVFCVETLTYTKYTKEQKLNNIIEFMKEKNYFVYADTYINTIFVDNNSWERKK
ncbi:MAG: FkbM family methyltransferase [Patescibacteria group bacterium]